MLHNLSPILFSCSTSWPLSSSVLSSAPRQTAIVDRKCERNVNFAMQSSLNRSAMSFANPPAFRRREFDGDGRGLFHFPAEGY
jgi:hypothetical protein